MNDQITAKHLVSKDKHRHMLYDHYHNSYEIIFVKKGTVEFTINDVKNIYKTNDIIFINNLDKHEMKQISDYYERYYILINPQLFDISIKEIELKSIFRTANHRFKNSIQTHTKDNEYLEAIFDKCTNEYNNQAPLWVTSIINNVYELLILLFRDYNEYFINTSNNHKFLLSTEIQTYLDTNYLKPITLDKLAHHMHLDKYYLLNIFKEITGYTIKQYVLLKRINYSKEQLVKSDSTITEIAYESGFNSCSNYIRCFSKHQDMTPLKFRNMYKQDLNFE